MKKEAKPDFKGRIILVGLLSLLVFGAYFFTKPNSNPPTTDALCLHFYKIMNKTQSYYYKEPGETWGCVVEKRTNTFYCDEINGSQLYCNLTLSEIK